MRFLLAISLIAFASTFSSPAQAIARSPKVTCGNWATIKDASGSGFLYSVSALSDDDVWVAGNTGSIWSLEHWDGSTWSLVHTPLDSTQTPYTFHKVLAISHNDVWAASSFDQNQLGASVAIHWNGTDWNVIPFDSSHGLGFGVSSMSASASNDVWAIEGGNDFSDTVSALRHWDGRQWNEVPVKSPRNGTTYFLSVSVAPGGSVWLSAFENNSTHSYPFIALNRHHQWSVSFKGDVSHSDDYLPSISALNANDVWLVGGHADGLGHGGLITYHWDGTQWNRIHVPGDLSTTLLAVSTNPINGAWTVGFQSNKIDDSRPVIAHWTGTKWKRVNISPFSGYQDELFAVAVTSSSIWAVGTRERGEQTLILHATCHS